MIAKIKYITFSATTMASAIINSTKVLTDFFSDSVSSEI